MYMKMIVGTQDVVGIQYSIGGLWMVQYQFVHKLCPVTLFVQHLSVIQSCDWGGGFGAN